MFFLCFFPSDMRLTLIRRVYETEGNCIVYS